MAVGGPLGAVLCSRMSRRWIVNCLLFLIALELVSTDILVPISRSVLFVSAGTLLVCGSLDWFMTRVKDYVPTPAGSVAQD